MYTLGLGRYDSPYGQKALRAVNQQQNNQNTAAKQNIGHDTFNPKYKNNKNTSKTSPLGMIALMLLSGIVAYKGKGAIQAAGKGIGKFFKGAGGATGGLFKKLCPNLSQAFISLGKAIASPFVGISKGCKAIGGFFTNIFHKTP